MNRFNLYLITSIVPLLVSCAATRQATVLDRIGPGPVAADAAKAEREGTLRVYSLRGNYDAEGVNYHPHTAYTVYSSDGQRLKEVKNTIYPYDEEPMAV